MKNQKNIKEFVVDADKWICGGGERKNNGLGKGTTSMQNDQGEMCCLGHCMSNMGFEPNGGTYKEYNYPFHKRTVRANYPSGVSENSKNRGYKANPFVTLDHENTRLSLRAAEINDEIGTPLKERVAKLKALFKSKGLTLRFKNIKKHL